MPCRICRRKLARRETLDHYWIEHRELILQKVRAAAEMRRLAKLGAEET
jgi:hypothetical protein